jgi:hypothetical protein
MLRECLQQTNTTQHGGLGACTEVHGKDRGERHGGDEQRAGETLNVGSPGH